MLKSKATLFALFLLFMIPNSSADVFINEFEQNPAGRDHGNEWVELYSGEEVNLSGWKLVNADDDTFLLNETINGYLVITFPSQWLDNSDEKVILVNSDGDVIDETPLLSDTSNDDLSWNLCGEEWKFVISTPGSENECGNGGGEGGEFCGDGIIQQGEECDNGSANGACSATCSTSCTINTCGNGNGNGNGGNGNGNGEENSDGDGNETNVQQERQEEKLMASATIIEKPSSMKFGEVKIVKASFFSNDNYDLLFLLYSAPKRVVRDIDGNVISKNMIKASTAVKARAYKGEEIEFSLPLKLFDNCNKYYEDGSYDIFLRVFYRDEEWNAIGDLASFSVSAEYNEDLCEEKPGVKEEKTITGKTSNVLYLSKSKIIKNIGLWILIALTILLLIVTWKRKLI